MFTINKWIFSLILLSALLLISSRFAYSQGDTPCDAVVLTVNLSCTPVNGTTKNNLYQTDPANGGTPSCRDTASDITPDVWYSFTAPPSGKVLIETYAGTIKRAGMALYSALTCSTGFTQLKCIEPDTLMPVLSNQGLTPGTLYYIRFWRSFTGSGTFSICLIDEPSPDIPCSAKFLPVNSTCNYTNETTAGLNYQTNSANGGVPSCGSPGSPDIWFKFIPNNCGVTISTKSGTITDGAMALYKANTCSTGFTQISCNDDYTGNMPSITTSSLIPGNTYYIRFWNANSGTGTFQICITDLPKPTADFSASSYNFCLGNSVILTDLSTDNPTSWSWSFSGATPATSNSQTPTIFYLGAGTYPVSLTVTNCAGSSSKTKNGYITVNDCPPNPQDCFDAIPICNNNFFEDTRFSNQGNIDDEIDSLSSCLSQGEKHCVWYIFTVKKTGKLDFTITPNNMNDDYDWAVYNLTNNNCNDIGKMPSLEVSCNYSGTRGLTGPDGSTTQTSGGAGASPFNAKIPVIVGETYAINVSQFTDASFDGYSINFDSSTTGVFDKSPPAIDSIITNLQCGDSTLLLKFTENIICSTAQSADFLLIGPDGNHSITSLKGFVCQIGGSFENDFTATVSPPIIRPGTYTMIITGDVFDNCDNNAKGDTFIFNLNFEVLKLSATSKATCNGSLLGEISISSLNGKPLYDYSIDSGLTFPKKNFAANTPAKFTGLLAGWYYIAGLDDRACPGNDSIEIKNFTSTLNVANDTLTICPKTQITGSVKITGGFLPLTYSWNTGDSTRNITKPNGTYTIIVKDSLSCEASAKLLINNFPDLQISAGLDDTVICGGTSTLLGSIIQPSDPPYQFKWFKNGTDMNKDSIGVASVGPGTYVFQITDKNLCVDRDTLVVKTALSDLTVTVGSDLFVCFGDSVSITASASSSVQGFQYQWTDGVIGATRFVKKGKFIVEVTNSSLCTATDEILVTENSEIKVDANLFHVTCFGNSNGSIELTVQGGTPAYTYSWSNGATVNPIDFLPPSCYSVTVTDSKLCSSTPPCYFIKTPTSALTIDQTSIKNVTCKNGTDGEINVIVTGGRLPYSFNWSNGAITEDITNLSENTYSLQVTDSSGCTASETYIITTTSNLKFDSPLKDSTICSGTQITIIASAISSAGSVSYNWVGGFVGPSRTVYSGAYVVIAKDGNNCTASDTVFVYSHPDFSVKDSIIPISCKGDSSGKIFLSITGTTSPYIYSWSNGSTAKDSLQNLLSGNYSCTVTDKNSCTTTIAINLPQPDSVLFADTVSITHIKCFGEITGAINIKSTGGTKPYTYIWNTAAISPNISGIAAGNYTLTVTDSLGCKKNLSVSVTQPLSGINVVRDSIIDVGCNGLSKGAIYINIVGGTAPYSYSWSNNSIAQDNLNLNVGNFYLTVTDMKLCTRKDTFIIKEISPHISTLLITPVPCKGEKNGAVKISTKGGVPPYAFSLNGVLPFKTDSNFIGLKSGSYKIIIRDADQCDDTMAVVITEPLDSLKNSFDTSTLIDSVCLYSTGGNVLVKTVGGTSPYSYVWKDQGGQVTGNDSVFKNQLPGTYSVKITDKLGCKDSLIFILNAYPDINISIDPESLFVCYSQSGIVTTLVSGTTPPYSYSWSNGQNTASVTVNRGIYQVTVTDNNNCAKSTSIEVKENNQILADFDNAIAACIGQTITIKSVVVGGSGDFYYQWYVGKQAIPGATNSFLTVPAGNYILVVTDRIYGKGLCQTPVNIDIGELPELVSGLSIPDTLCYGEKGTIQLDPSGGSGNGYKYKWTQLNDLNNVLSTEVSYTTGAGDYYVLLTDSVGCKSEDTIFVKQHPDFSILFTPEPGVTTTLDPEVKFINIYSGFIDTWTWDYGDGDRDTMKTFYEPVHTYKEPGYFKVCLTASDPYKCKKELCQNVIIEPDHTLFYPTAFLPGSNSQNAIFTAKGEGIERFKLQIYNRWGREVYTSFDMNKGWDGTDQSGKVLPEGVYTFMISYRGVGSLKEIRAGTVTILRRF